MLFPLIPFVMRGLFFVLWIEKLFVYLGIFMLSWGICLRDVLGHKSEWNLLVGLDSFDTPKNMHCTAIAFSS